MGELEVFGSTLISRCHCPMMKMDVISWFKLIHDDLYSFYIYLVFIFLYLILIWHSFSTSVYVFGI